MKLKDLGYSTFFEELRVSLKITASSLARVTSCHKDAYTVVGEKAEYSAKITGKIFYDATTKEKFPAVGDWVSISGLEEDHPTINTILPRKNSLIRKSKTTSDNQIIGANIDVGFIVQGLDRDFNLNRLERYMTAIINCKIKPVLILNKTDLISEEKLHSQISKVKNRFGDLHIITTSRMTKKGINILMGFIEKGLTYCFLGSSGVGKSSLINCLLGKETLEIGPLSDYTKKGMHTTSLRSLLILDNGGIVIDNPGMREFGMSGDLTEEDTGEMFNKIEDLAINCKYSNCSHNGEAGCAIQQAIDSGELDEKKYLDYIKLEKEIRYNTMTKLEKRKKDKKFGKFVKSVMKHKKNTK